MFSFFLFLLQSRLLLTTYNTCKVPETTRRRSLTHRRRQRRRRQRRPRRRRSAFVCLVVLRRCECGIAKTTNGAYNTNKRTLDSTVSRRTHFIQPQHARACTNARTHARTGNMHQQHQHQLAHGAQTHKLTVCTHKHTYRCCAVLAARMLLVWNESRWRRGHMCRVISPPGCKHNATSNNPVVVVAR